MPLESDVNQLGVAALAIVSLAVIVGVGSIVLTEMQPASFQDSEVQNERHQPATPFPTNITVDQVSGDADFERLIEDSETLTFQDTSASTNTTLTVDTDYNVYVDDGNYELLNTSTTTDFDSTSDFIFVEYQYEYSGTPTSVLETGVTSMQSFADFFTVIVVISIAAVLFLMLRVVRSSSRAVGA